MSDAKSYKIRLIASPFVRVLQTSYRLIEGISPSISHSMIVPFKVDYLLCEWQAAYLYPNKKDETSPVEHILLRTLPKERI